MSDLFALEKRTSIYKLRELYPNIPRYELSRVISLALARYYGVTKAVLLENRSEVLLFNNGTIGKRSVRDLDFDGLSKAFSEELRAYSFLSAFRTLFFHISQNNYIVFGKKIFESENAIYFSIYFKRELMTDFKAVVSKEEMRNFNGDVEVDFIPLSLNFTKVEFLKSGVYVNAVVRNRQLIQMNIATSVSKLRANGIAKLHFTIRKIDYNKRIVIINSKMLIIKDVFEYVEKRLLKAYGLELLLIKEKGKA